MPLFPPFPPPIFPHLLCTGQTPLCHTQSPTPPVAPFRTSLREPPREQQGESPCQAGSWVALCPHQFAQPPRGIL